MKSLPLRLRSSYVAISFMTSWKSFGKIAVRFYAILLPLQTSPGNSPGRHRFQRAVSAIDVLIRIGRHRTGSDAYPGLVSINASFAETARWKRCVPRQAAADRHMNKLSTGIIAVLSLVALSQRHGASPLSPAQAEARRAIVGAYDSAHINGIVFI